MGLEPVEENPRATDEANLRAMVRHGQGPRRAGAHVRRPTGRSTSASRRCPNTASWRGSITTASRPGARVDADTLHQAGRARLRAVEGDQTRRADVGLRLRSRPAGLAHRVLGDGAAAAGRPADRHPRRRHRPHLPAPRERDRAGGGRDRRAVSYDSGSTSSSSTSTTRRCRSRSATCSPCATSSTKGYRASSLRYLLISVHYRKQLTFNWDVLAQADAAMTRLADFLARLETCTRRNAHPAIADRVARGRTEFRDAIADDLNIPAAQGVMFELLREMNAAIDQGDLRRPDAALVRQPSTNTIGSSACSRLRRAEDERRRSRRRRSNN